MSSSVSPIPEGFRSVTPAIVVNGGAKAIEFYQRAFGAEEIMRLAGDDGKIMHAEIRIGDSIIMMGDEFPDWGYKAPLPNHVSGSLNLYVPDADKAFARAIEAGCTVAMPLMDAFWGDRYGKVIDPFGHTWGIATHVEDVSPEECARRAKAWKPQCE